MILTSSNSSITGITRLAGAGHTLKAPNEFIMTISPAKRDKSSTLMEFAEQQKLFACSAEAPCGEHLSLSVCPVPANLVTPLRCLRRQGMGNTAEPMGTILAESLLGVCTENQLYRDRQTACRLEKRTRRLPRRTTARDKTSSIPHWSKVANGVNQRERSKTHLAPRSA